MEKNQEILEKFKNYVSDLKADKDEKSSEREELVQKLEKIDSAIAEDDKLIAAIENILSSVIPESKNDESNISEDSAASSENLDILEKDNKEEEIDSQEVAPSVVVSQDATKILC